ncbi:hypothetical protein VIBNISOn1_p0207 [Vibrio nigripulchritudo SOn1]|uniref:Uncharacterized protein n=2 Tax=Vibrio nigripulchritudo TaxID=28173 RepID=A0AAV2W2D3_9VIBR|nr:hypothetical protein VIBNISOn1_p0207 [Vibrio nigripulchritudo SOn1]
MQLRHNYVNKALCIGIVSMSKSKIPQEMFQHVVNNALDFLGQSIAELQQKPKYSVIHFHAAIELVLKARLMSEHWSLVVSPKKQADWQEFTQGKFVSVTLEEAATRLEKVAQSGLGDKQLKLFRAVTKHRNQMVHLLRHGRNRASWNSKNSSHC